MKGISGNPAGYVCFILLLIGLFIGPRSVRAQNLLSPATGSRLTYIGTEYNNTIYAAKNLNDGESNSQWLGKKSDYDYNLIWQISSAGSLACFNTFTLENYDTTRAIRSFSLLRSTDLSIAGDPNSIAWVPIPSELSPTGPVNHLLWAQGGRLISVDSEYNDREWGGKNLNDGDSLTHWLSSSAHNVLEYDFDYNWDGSRGDAINIKQLRLFNYAHASTSKRAIKMFQVEIQRVGDSAETWTKLEVPGSVAGDTDFNFLLAAEGGVLSDFSSQYNDSGYAAANLNDGDYNSGWLSSYGNNTIEYVFDTDSDGDNGKIDVDDRFTIEKFYLRNHANASEADRMVRSFQVEVQTAAGGDEWLKLEVPGSHGESDFNFLLAAEGGVLSDFSSQYNDSGYAAANLNDGDYNRGWLSAYGNNTIEYVFDTDGDGDNGKIDADDRFTLEMFYLRNHANPSEADRMIRSFQVEVQTAAGGDEWQKLEVPGSTSESDFNFLLAAEGGVLSAFSSQYNATNYAAANLNDGDYNRGWLSSHGNNTIEYVFDTNGDGDNGKIDAEDRFTLEKFYLRNHANASESDRMVRSFQVEVQTAGSGDDWQKLEVPGSHGESDFNFLLAAEGGVLSAFSSQYNATSYAAANLNDGDQNTFWLSSSISSDFDYDFDTNGDGSIDDAINLRALRLVNRTSARAVKEFELYVKILDQDWQRIDHPDGTPFFTVQQSASMQRWDFPEIEDVTSVRFRTLDNYGDRYIEMSELEILGESSGPSHTFVADQDSSGQLFILDSEDQPADVTAVRFRTINNYGDPRYIAAEEFEVLGPLNTPSHTFIANQDSSGQLFVLDAEDQPADVTAVRFRTINNYGDPRYIAAEEFEVMGPLNRASHTFIANQDSSGQLFVLDVEDQPSDVTAVRFRTINNYGDPRYIGAEEFEVIGPSTGPSHTFIADVGAGPYDYLLDAEDQVDEVVKVRFITLRNHGDRYTGAGEFELLGDPVGPSYVFTAEQASEVQEFEFPGVYGRLFQLHVINNHGDRSYFGAREATLQSSNRCSVGIWHMDKISWLDEVFDSSGNGYHGYPSPESPDGPVTAIGDEVLPAIEGNPGTCRYGVFDGLDDYINIPDFPDLTSDKGFPAGFTLTAWVRPEGSEGGIIFSDNDGASGFGLNLEGGASGRLTFYREDSGGESSVEADTSLVFDDWNFVAAVHDVASEEMRLYLNGELVGQSDNPFGWMASTGSAVIGGDELLTAPFVGQLDEVQLFGNALNSADIQAIMTETHGCPEESAIDHIRIEHSETGLTCQTSQVTLRACVDAECSAEYDAQVTVTMTSVPDQPLGWVGDNVTFTGNRTLQLAQTSAGTLSLAMANSSPIAANGYRCYEDGIEGDCTIEFYDTAIFIDGDSDAGTSDSDIETQIAGKPSNVAPDAQIFKVRVLRTDGNTGACVGSLANYSDVLFSYLVPEINNGLADNSITLTSDTSESATLASVGNTKQLKLNFDTDGAAAFWLNSVDAGKYQLKVSMDILVTDSDGNPLTDADGKKTGETINVSDTSNAFVVRPFAVFADAASNPKAQDGDGDAYKKTGESFSLNYKSLAWTAAREGTTVDGKWESCGSSTLADPGTGYVRVPQWDLGQPGASLVKPSGGTSGTLKHGDGAVTIAAKGTSASVDNVTYDRVGIIQLAQNGIDKFLGQSVALCSPYIGRFYPDHFQLTQGVLTSRVESSCSTASAFTYLDENLQFNYTLTAKKNSGATATNYIGSFAKFSGKGAVRNGSTATYTVGAVDDPAGTATDLSSRLDIDTSSVESNWSAGVASFNIKLNVDRAVAVDGPFIDTRFGVFVQDSDGVEIKNPDLDVDSDTVMDHTQATDAASLRYGRLRLGNAHGSEMLVLPMLMQAEYWNGSAFSLNSADSCSSFSAADLTLDSDEQNDIIGGSPIEVKGEVTTSATIAENPLTNGDGALEFSAPGSGGDGWVDVELNVPDYLKFDWSGTGDENPTSRATFGIYQGNERIIYIRETTWR